MKRNVTEKKGGVNCNTVGCALCGNVRTILRIREMLSVPPGVDILVAIKEKMGPVKG